MCGIITSYYETRTVVGLTYISTADRHSLQFTVNKIVYKIFGAISTDLYIEIRAQFGTESVENMVANRRNCFINRYGETDNYLCQFLR